MKRYIYLLLSFTFISYNYFLLNEIKVSLLLSVFILFSLLLKFRKFFNISLCVKWIVLSFFIIIYSNISLNFNLARSLLILLIAIESIIFTKIIIKKSMDFLIISMMLVFIMFIFVAIIFPNDLIDNINFVYGKLSVIAEINVLFVPYILSFYFNKIIRNILL